MNGKQVRLGLILAIVLATTAALAGCDKDDETPPPPNPAPVTPTPPAPDVTPKTGGRAGAPNAGDTPSTEDGADGAPATTTTPDPKAAAGADKDDPATARERQATEHLAKTAQLLNEKKPELARKELAQAEAMEESLPQTLREQIKTMRANVDSFARSENAPVSPPPPPPDEENK